MVCDDSIYSTPIVIVTCIHSDNLCLLSAIGTAVSVDWSSVLVKPSKSCKLRLFVCVYIQLGVLWGAWTSIEVSIVMDNCIL